MSYLPRMSKTYREPQPQNYEDPEPNLSSYSLQPASSILNERTNNPQTALRHYRYLPHPPPVLPGPSLMAEALENEHFQENSRSRRSSSTIRVAAAPTQTILNPEPAPEKSEVMVLEEKSIMINQMKQTQSRKTLARSKSNIGKKKPSSKSLTDRKKANASKTHHVSVNLCLVEPGLEKSFTSAQIERTHPQEDDDQVDHSTKEEINASETDTTNKSKTPTSSVKKSHLNIKKMEVKPKEFVNKSIQCTIFGSSEKVIVIPFIINSLLRALAFLLHELNREESINSTSGERKRLMTQVQLILGDLCAQYVEKDFGFDITYSDSKRMEKILTELQKYVKDTYGDKEEYIDKVEDLKKVFINLKKKELELALVTDKVQENDNFQIEHVEIKDGDLKNAEITLQNKRLESEQLSAEVEFSSRELINYQKTIAEVDWEIKYKQDQVVALKKSLASKSKTEILGRKMSSEIAARKSKSKESEQGGKKKT